MCELAREIRLAIAQLVIPDLQILGYEYFLLFTQFLYCGSSKAFYEPESVLCKFIYVTLYAEA